MFILYNNDTLEFETFTTDQLLAMINRDRSEDWSEYTKDSTIKEIEEAVKEFCYPYTIESDMIFKTRS